MYRYKINTITLNDGSTQALGTLTVIVGPNNVGKSRALRDLVSICAPDQHQPRRTVVLADAAWTMPRDYDDLKATGKLEVFVEEDGQQNLRGMDPNLTGQRQTPITGWNEDQLRKIAEDKRIFSLVAAAYFIAHLGTSNRLTMVGATGSPSNLAQANHVLHQLFAAGSTAVDRIRAIIRDQFRLDVTLDYSGLTTMLMRVGKDLSNAPGDPRELLKFVQGLEKLDDQGDGLRAFIGIVTALVASKRDVYLIDEPEAFLHPPQAFRMGAFIAEHANDERQIVVATHSTDVLEGLLSRPSDAMVLRIDRVEDRNSYRVLDKGDLSEIAKDPLLQSARVLEGIFSPAAQIVEADSDARFYAAASRMSSPSLDVHTVSAQNKQTVTRVSALYRKLGIRRIGIVDFDVLNDHDEFSQQLDALDIPPADKAMLLATRKEIAEFVERASPAERLAAAERALTELTARVEAAKAGTATESQRLTEISRGCYRVVDQTKAWSQAKRDGRAVLDAGLQTKFDELAAVCLSKGLAINPYGELESMLVDIGMEYTTAKHVWIAKALKLLQDLTVRPDRNLWRFMTEIHRQLLPAGLPEPAGAEDPTAGRPQPEVTPATR